MRIVPVIDLKDGVVVRGVAGRRAQYRPVRSCLAGDPTPGSIARAFVEKFGFPLVYVADLDAIAGGAANWGAFEQIAGAGLGMWIDAGISDRRRALELSRHGPPDGAIDGVVVGLESVASPGELRGLLETIGAQRGIFSIDLREGQPMTGSASWQRYAPAEIADVAVEAGFRRLIALDLAAVGVQQGPKVTAVCRAIRRRYPGIELVSGGGVRGVEDIRGFLAAGCTSVLVASALHDGRLTRAEVDSLDA